VAAREAAEHRQYAEAERLFAAAALKAERFGREDPRVALSLSNLAQLFHSQGRYVDAEPLYHRALTIYEKAHGSEHADVAATLNNLGVLHRMHGQFADAEPLLQRALTIKEKVLGRRHPDVGSTIRRVATSRPSRFISGPS
jgi:tetratricopeptide (TPR) repeat protein